MLVQEERWATFYPECLPLFEEHHKEIGETDDRIPLEPDVETCARLDELGAVQIITARKEGKLVGYCVFSIAPSLASKNVLCGTQSLFFVTKEERRGRVAIELYMESIKAMKEKGVKNIYPHHWMRGESPRLKSLFEHIGAVEIEHVYSLWIG